MPRKDQRSPFIKYVDTYFEGLGGYDQSENIDYDTDYILATAPPEYFPPKPRLDHGWGVKTINRRIREKGCVRSDIRPRSHREKDGYPVRLLNRAVRRFDLMKAMCLNHATWAVLPNEDKVLAYAMNWARFYPEDAAAIDFDPQAFTAEVMATARQPQLQANGTDH